MEPKWILMPLAAQVLLTYIVGIMMRIRRGRAVKEGADWRYFKTFEGEKPPRYVLQTDQHFTNMFEMPLLFFVCGIVAMIMDVVTQELIALSWLYVIGRSMHAYISLTNNRLLWRARVFVASSFVLALMWGLLLVLTMTK